MPLLPSIHRISLGALGRHTCALVSSWRTRASSFSTLSLAASASTAYSSRSTHETRSTRELCSLQESTGALGVLKAGLGRERGVPFPRRRAAGSEVRRHPPSVEQFPGERRAIQMGSWSDSTDRAPYSRLASGPTICIRAGEAPSFRAGRNLLAPPGAASK